MTDLDKLIQLLQDFKIPFVAAYSAGCSGRVVHLGKDCAPSGDVCRHYEGDEGKISKHFDFCTYYYFNNDDKFELVYIGE